MIMNIEQLAQEIVAQVLGADAAISGKERVQRVIDLLVANLGKQHGIASF